jgi:hypothetical protein
MHNKIEHSPEHDSEFLVIQTVDRKDNKERLFIIERTVDSKRDPDFADNAVDINPYEKL